MNDELKNDENHYKDKEFKDKDKDFRDKDAMGKDAMDMGEGHGDKKRFQRGRFRRKVLDTRNLVLDYKNGETLERFISKTGKILPRRITGANARIQRKIASEIRRSRMIGLLPFSRR